MQDLAYIEQKILSIQEQAHVSNVLIFGKQEPNKDFKLSLVVYPKCNWIEKIKGLIHVIFGSPSLTKDEIQQITDFYHTQLHPQDLPINSTQLKEGKRDLFCNEQIVNSQKIIDLTIDYHVYHLLHDNRPKGVTVIDPHLLIIPAGKNGHYDGSQFSYEKRNHLLRIAQKVARIFLLENPNATLLLLERNGKELRSVDHKHLHMINIACFPQTFIEKVYTFIRQLFPAVLSNMEERIKSYQKYQWDTM